MRRRERPRGRLGPERHRFRGAHAAGPAALDDEPGAARVGPGAGLRGLPVGRAAHVVDPDGGDVARLLGQAGERDRVAHLGEPQRVRPAGQEDLRLGARMLDQDHAAIVADIAGAGLARRRAGHLLRVVAGGEHEQQRAGRAASYLSPGEQPAGQPERQQHPGRQGAERRRRVAGGAGVDPGEPGHQPGIGEAGEVEQAKGVRRVEQQQRPEQARRDEAARRRPRAGRAGRCRRR